MFSPLPAITASTLQRIAADDSLLNPEATLREVVLYNVLPQVMN